MAEELPITPPALPFPVIGIGASAGGLAAIEAFFSGMPTAHEIGMAFVIVQHLAPDHRSLLTELVRRFTRMQVAEVEDGVTVEPNRVYIIPPNKDLVMDGTRLRLEPPIQSRPPPPDRRLLQLTGPGSAGAGDWRGAVRHRQRWDPRAPHHQGRRRDGDRPGPGDRGA